MLSPAALAATLSDWALELYSLAGTVVLAAGGFVGRNHKRSKKNERRLEGDPDDPNHEGLLEIADDTRNKVDQLEDKMDEQHERLVRRVEELADD